MSRISQDFINDLGSLYEHIHIKDQDFLNEESEHYDAEATEIVEDILSTISLSMVYEGYSAEGIIGFLSDSSEQDIIEKYLNFDENILTESTVSEDHIQEQFEQLNEFIGAALRIAGAGLKAAKYAKGAKGLAPLARLGSALKGAGTATSRVAQQGTKASAVVRPALSKGVQKVKDIAKGAKAALTSPTAKKIGLGALGAGALVGLPYVGAKLAGAGSEKQDSPKPSPTETPSPKDDFLKGSALAKLGGREGRIKDGEFRTMSWSPESKARYASATKSSTSSSDSSKPTPSRPSTSTQVQKPAPAKPAAAKPATGMLGKTSYERRTPTSAELKGAQEYRQQNPNAKPEDVLKAAQLRGKQQASVDADLKKANSPEELNKPAPAGTALAAEQERRRKKAQETSAETTKESYDAYDIILEYLIDTKQVDTLEEAHYVMLEMDETAIGSIIEQYEDYLLSEEIGEWVNNLVEEGYDLSEYTWDEIVEHYITNV